MLLRGMGVAVALLVGAALTLQLTGGEATVSNIGTSATDTQPTLMGKALASLHINRPMVTGDGAAAPQDVPEAPESFLRAFKVKSGDTMSRILERAGADAKAATDAIRALRTVFNPRTLRAGQTINVAYTPTMTPNDSNSFAGFEIPLDYATSVHVAPAPEGGYLAYEVEHALETRQVRAEGSIDWSLFAAGSDAGVPTKVMSELVRAFSWDVDFQRDIRKDDRFEVMFERKVNEANQPVHDGRILFASLTLSGDRKAVYLHQLKDGTWEYFDEKGQSAKKALMRTPIDGARLSSSFGVRKHPILGYTKKHTGTDFAASPGTPIFAAGDGVVEQAGWFGGYGKYVRIRHNSEYSTAYAHMKGFNRGVGTGKRVRQGDVIGFVGTTGQSTGPHLHFEVIRKGVKMNPMSVKMPSGQKLAGQELTRFEATRNNLNTQWASLKNTGQRLASK